MITIDSSCRYPNMRDLLVDSHILIFLKTNLYKKI